MITLFSYPRLFGVADNNPYGLKVFAFLKLAQLSFRHEHILDAKAAPRGQLPYIIDDGESLGDSDAIVSHLTEKYHLSIDAGLTEAQRTLGHLIGRTLDDLYWVMSYSRWSAAQFWPLFRDAFLKTHPAVTTDDLEGARKYNLERYRYQGVGRYDPEAVFDRGVADLRALATLVPDSGFLFGAEPTSVDAGLYGFLANIYFFDIDTPLKAFVSSRPNLVRHCTAIHAAVTGLAGLWDALG